VLEDAGLIEVDEEGDTIHSLMTRKQDVKPQKEAEQFLDRMQEETKK
jgi:hypothetical protein